MNKIILDNSSNVDLLEITQDTTININYNNVKNKLYINVKPNVNLTILDLSIDTRNDITFDIDNNCNILVNKISVDCSDNITVNINGENSFVTIYTSIINYKDNTYKETINHVRENSKSKVVNHCVNVKDNTFKFIVDGKISKEALLTNFNQDNKIININGGKSYILPNLIVDNNDIEASHSAFIGQFDEEILFYLMTRGINEKCANSLLIKAFLTNNMEQNDEMKEYLDKLIKNI